MRRFSGVGPTVTFVTVLAFGACGTPEVRSERLEIYAASSLTEAFRDLTRLFEAAHPGTEVVLVFAGSQVLRLQVEHGAEPDLYASADVDHMRALAEGGFVHESEIFAHNELALIVPAGDSSAIRAFEALPDVERLVIGTANVPAGRYARELLRRADSELGRDFGKRVLERVVSEEANVRLTRAKVELGEADAAFVYATDVIGSGIRRVPIPERFNVRVDYLIGRLEASPAPQLADLWLDFLRSPAGHEVLRRHGFLVR